MRDFFNSAKFKVILAIIALMFGFMIQAAYTGNLSSVATKALGFVTAPFQAVSTGVTNAVDGFFAKLQDTERLLDEIEQLKEENRQLKQDVADLNRYKEQNDAYKEVLGIKEEQPEYEMVVCDVIGRDPADRFYSFTINRGENAGIAVQDIVITEDGLAGMIIDVGPNYATVMTVLDPGFVVGCYSAVSRDTGSLRGDASLYLDGRTKMQYISMESTIAVGESIMTSGGKNSFAPSDIMIGTVKTVRVEDHGISQYAEIQPAVDVSRVSTVIVITDF